MCTHTPEEHEFLRRSSQWRLLAYVGTMEVPGMPRLVLKNCESGGTIARPEKAERRGEGGAP